MFGVKWLLILCVTVATLFGAPSPAQSPSEANALFVEAVQLYRASESKSQREKAADLRRVRDLFEQIVATYPDSPVAEIIATQEAPAGVDVSRLPASRADIQAEIDAYDLPLEMRDTILVVAQAACGEGDPPCTDDIAAALTEFVFRRAFDQEALMQTEQMRWLFSNPGRFGSDIDRLDAFDEALQDTTFRDGLIDRLNARVLSNMAREAAVDFSMVLITGLTSEALARHYERSGQPEAAAFTRRWFEPMVDIGLVLQSASTATVATAGTGAVLIWLNNAFALAHLGEKQVQAEATGTTPEAMRERLAAEIDSYTRTLASGRMTGIMFEGNEDRPLTERHAEVLQSVLADHYKLQRFWLDSDEVILLETFDLVLVAAREFYETMSFLTEPQPLDAADGSGALPADLQGLGLQPAPDGFLGPPTEFERPVTATSQLQMFNTLPDGLYASDPEVCSHQGESVVETVDRPFRLLNRPKVGMFDQICDIAATADARDAVEVTLACNAEGMLVDRVMRWQITSPQSFIELSAFGRPREYRLCEPDAATPGTSPNSSAAAPSETTTRAQADGIVVPNIQSMRNVSCPPGAYIECINALDISREAANFTWAYTMAVERQMPNLATAPIGFAELVLEHGDVDLVLVRNPWDRDFRWSFVMYVRGEALIIAWPLHGERALAQDSASRRWRAHNPQANFDIPGLWLGHRKLRDGTQRFVFGFNMSGFCAGCGVMALSTWFYDFGPNGQILGVREAGITDLALLRGQDIMGETLQFDPAGLQSRLLAAGFDPGPVDGVTGQMTQNALAAFAREQCFADQGGWQNAARQALASLPIRPGNCGFGQLETPRPRAGTSQRTRTSGGGGFTGWADWMGK